MDSTAEQQVPDTDVIGVGFGPSNLSLAVAIAEHNRQAPVDRSVSAVFFERQPRFGWHRDMLIDGTTVQVSFLKDLVTMRDPTSEFSFLSYLFTKGRLVDFINHKTLFPSRAEFHDYLGWVASRVAHLVDYDREVVGITPVISGGTVTAMDVAVRAGAAEEPRTWRTRNVVIGVGLRPRLPVGVSLTDRIWHSDELLGRLDGRVDWSPRRIVVVGAGQSAAEIVEYLHRRYEGAEVCAVFSRYGYSPADDSPFANRVFDPGAVDVYFGAREEARRMILGYHANTNYSVVDVPLIDELYRRAYQEQVTGRRRLRFLNLCRMVHTHDTGRAVRAVVESLADGRTEVLEADAVVYATGYEPVDPLELLGDLKDYCLLDGDGRLAMRRDHQVVTSGDLDCGIYLQGGTEHTHGISSNLLSTVAVRADEVFRSITSRVDAALADSGA
jgi:L-ornithine N5-monooxygenase